jgi:histidinol-phosphatase (PHP family)
VESILHFPDYDAIAHLGYVSKFAPYPKEIRPMRYHHAPDAIDTLLKALAESGKALEINASGLRETDSPIPGADIIRRFLELKGEFFTFGSDAHKTGHIYLHVEQAKEIAISCGAKWQLSFECRKGLAFPI